MWLASHARSAAVSTRAPFTWQPLSPVAPSNPRAGPMKGKGRKKQRCDASDAAAPAESQPDGSQDTQAAQKAHLFNLLRSGSKRARSSPEQSEVPQVEKKKTKAEATSPTKPRVFESVPDRQPDTWPETVRPSGAPAVLGGKPVLCPVSPCATEVDTFGADGAGRGSQQPPVQPATPVASGNPMHCLVSPAAGGAETSPTSSAATPQTLGKVVFGMATVPSTPAASFSASASQPATPAAASYASEAPAESQGTEFNKHHMDRAEYTKWRMKYVRSRENKNKLNPVPPTIMAALAAGEDLFDIFVKCNGIWENVKIHKELVMRHRRGSRDCDAKMNKDQLLQHYCGNTELVDAIIKEKTSSGEWEPHPDAPHCEAGRLYKVWHSSVASKEAEAEDTTSASISTSLKGQLGVDALSALRGAEDKLFEKREKKPAPKPKPKRELTDAEKKMAQVKRQDGKLRATMRECASLLSKSEQDEWKFGVEKLKSHEKQFKSIEQEFQKTLLLDVTDANMASMDAVLQQFEKAEAEYSSMARRVRASLASKDKPAPKPATRQKPKKTGK
jgi:hypothetical protein